MYTLTVYKINKFTGQHEEILLAAQNDLLNRLLEKIESNGLGLGKMKVLNQISLSYDELILVTETQSGELVDFVFCKEGSNIKHDLIKALRGK